MVLRRYFVCSVRGCPVLVLFFVCLLAVVTARGQEAAPRGLIIKVHDEASLPVAKAQITLHVNGTTVWSGTTNDRGEASISGREFPDFELSVSKKGYEAVVGRKIALEGQIVEVEVTLLHKLQVKETVTVKAGQTPTASTAEELQRAEIKQLPNRPANIADAVVFTPAWFPPTRAEAARNGILNSMIRFRNFASAAAIYRACVRPRRMSALAARSCRKSCIFPRPRNICWTRTQSSPCLSHSMRLRRAWEIFSASLTWSSHRRTP